MTPAEGIINKLHDAVTTKQAINASSKLVKAKASKSKITTQYKIIVFSFS
jgi:hypothetical protein